MRLDWYAYPGFNLQALLSLATRLRGRACTADESKSPNTGSFNWVIFITFDDGVEWVFRSPQRTACNLLSEESTSKTLISEAATLKYLHAHSSVPVPEVFSFSGNFGNEIGVPYILMSKVSGRPLSDYDWVKRPRIPGGSLRSDHLPIADQDQVKVMTQLGAIMSHLAEMHFDKIGSLVQDENGNYSIGECLSPALNWKLRDKLEDIDRGPFDHESQYFRSLISIFVTHAKEMYLGPHVFFAPTPRLSEYSNLASLKQAEKRWHNFFSEESFDEIKNCLSYCIAGDFLYEMISRLTSTSPFVLSHPDLHFGNIFVDEDFNITSIIDWSSTTTVPMSELLAGPRINSSLATPKQALVAAFRSGFCQRDQSVEPEQWRTADKIWHFTRLVSMRTLQDYTHFKALYDLVYENDFDNIPKMFYERSMEERGRALYAKFLQEEMEWEAEEEQDKEQEDDEECYVDDSENPAIAMKLNLMSEMNHNFIADKRLWQWIEKALQLAEEET